MTSKWSLENGELAKVSEGDVEQSLFFELVRLGRTGRGTSSGTPLYRQHGAIMSEPSKERHNVEVRAHICRLFLNPDDLLCVRMLIQGGLQILCRPGVKLLKKDDGDRGVFALFAFDAQVVADLARADEETARVFDGSVG